MKGWKKRGLALGLCLCLCGSAAPARAITVEQMRALLEERYVDAVPAAALEQETVEATVAALGDPYSEYLTAAELEEYLNTDVDETIVGIGVTMILHDEGAEVVRPEEGGPAYEAGLRAGDILVAAGGVSLKGLTLDEVADLIRGEEGTSARLTYRRGNVRRTVSVERRKVVIAATRGELLEGGIGYIQCDEFGSDTAGHFRTLIERMDGDANVWVVDLRGNPGGTVDAVSEVGCLFAGRGAYINLRNKDRENAYYGRNSGAVTDKPVVILVDGSSASASEAVTAALRDYGRAVVIGERTFGKGIAQDLFWDEQYPEYFTDGDGVKLTTARFFSPVGNTNDSLGVVPDLCVDPRLALEVVKLLAPTWSEEKTEDPLLFRLGGQWYTVELAGLEEDETGRAALGALLDALPRSTTVARNGSVVDIDEVYEAFGLESDHWEFPDGDQGTVCGADVFDTLYTYGFLAGEDDGLVHPQDPLTRAEMCWLVAVALQCRMPGNDCPFADVPADAWYAPAVTALANRGMVQGDENGLFHPEATVDHQQFITVMGRLAAWLNCDLDDLLASAGEEELALRALERYDGWAKSSVWLLTCGIEDEHRRLVNLLWAEPKVIDPYGDTTRDEAAAVMYELLWYLNIL